MKSWGPEAGLPGLRAWAPGSDSHGLFLSSQDRVLCGGQAESLPSFERCGCLLGLCHLFDAFTTIMCIFHGIFSYLLWEELSIQVSPFSSGGISMAEQLSQHMMGPGAENVCANT